MSDAPSVGSPDRPAARHETRDVDVRGVAKAGLGLALGTAAAGAVVWLLYGSFERRARSLQPAYPLAVGQDVRRPPEPRLQVTPRQDLEAYLEAQQELLTGYHWVDKEAGTVRIPIDVAMSRVVAQGLPSRRPLGRSGRAP